jgi:hypothetical protein
MSFLYFVQKILLDRSRKIILPDIFFLNSACALI